MASTTDHQQERPSCPECGKAYHPWRRSRKIKGSVSFVCEYCYSKVMGITYELPSIDDIRDTFRDRAERLIKGFYNDFFHEPDHFSFTVLENAEELDKAITDITSYSMIRGATYLYRDIVLFHVGSSEFKVLKWMGMRIQWRTCESLTTANMDAKKILKCVNEFVKPVS